MKYIVKKGCLLAGEKRNVGDILTMDDSREVRNAVAFGQIEEYKEVVAKPKAEVVNRDPKPTSRRTRKTTV